MRRCPVLLAVLLVLVLAPRALADAPATVLTGTVTTTPMGSRIAAPPSRSPS